MAKKRRKHHSKVRKHARRARKSARRHKGKRRGGSSARMIKAFWRKHRAKIMKISPKKRFKFVWSQIKRGSC